jgi:MFS family permease
MHYPSYGTITSTREEARVVDDMADLERTISGSSRTQQPGTREKDTIAMRPLLEHDDDPDRDSTSSDEDYAQTGVLRQEAISSTWSSTGLYCAYVGIALIACATSLENQTTNNLTIFATSAFSSHSLVATVGVVHSVILSVAKPPMSKIADVFGRFEAFTLSILICIIGYIQQASSDSVKAYAAAEIFYASGTTGLQILTQIFIADTSDLLNRAFCAALPGTPFLLTVWIGPQLAEVLLDRTSWRWGYGIWAVILPITFVPLAGALFINQRKAAKQGILPESPFKDLSIGETALKLWFELDVFGLLLICAAFSLILIPLTLASSAGWENGSLLAMLVVGVLCLLAFPIWEKSSTLAPKAFFPRSLLHNRTVVAGMGIAFFYFSKSTVLVASIHLTSSSGVLPQHIPLLPVLFNRGQRRIGIICWPDRAVIHLHSHHHLASGLPSHQEDQKVQNLCRGWLRRVLAWIVSHALLPYRKRIEI